MRKYIFVLFLVVASTVAIHADEAEAPDAFDSCVSKLQEMIASKHYDEALSLSDMMLDAFPDNSARHSVRAWVLYSCGRHNECMKLIIPSEIFLSDCLYNDYWDRIDEVQNHDVNYDYHPLMHALADEHPLEFRELLKAERQKVGPDSLNFGFYDMGTILLSSIIQKGCYRDALDLCLKLEKIAPDELKGSNLMSLHLAFGEYDKVKELYDKLSATVADADIQRTALALARGGGLKKGLELLEPFVNAEYPPMLLLNCYAQLATLDGQYDKASTVIAKALELGDDTEYDEDEVGEIMIRKGILACRHNDMAAAREAFSPLIEAAEENPYMAALSYAWLGEIDNAKIWMKKAHGYMSDLNAAALYNLTGDADKALEIIGDMFSQGAVHPSFLNTDIQLQSLRNHPDYEKTASLYNNGHRLDELGTKVMDSN